MDEYQPPTSPQSRVAVSISTIEYLEYLQSINRFGPLFSDTLYTKVYGNYVQKYGNKPIAFAL